FLALPDAANRALELGTGGGPRRCPLHAALHLLRTVEVDVDVTLLMRGHASGESLPVRPDALRKVVQLVVLRERDHEGEGDRHRFGAARAALSLDAFPVDAPVRGRQPWKYRFGRVRITRQTSTH